MIHSLIKFYFSTVKVLAQRPTHISAVATVLLITKTSIVKYYERDRQTDRKTDTDTQRYRDRETETDRQTQTHTETQRETDTHRHTERQGQ